MIQAPALQTNQPAAKAPVKVKSMSTMGNDLPCSAFFQNDANFERTKITSGDVAGAYQDSLSRFNFNPVQQIGNFRARDV